ncbi:hypothetical protein P886_4990 [Alteromonadaceae bacterium 2753L.S.0a.02]|nr:hypothetical protein P886_4990 [Alteromonadaceae bacterium 2753L.S.0a.02]
MQSNFQSNVPGYSVVEGDSQQESAAPSGVSKKRERRNRSKPIPYNLSEYLNEDQSMSLRHMESFGWQLAFIRRPLFQDPMVVVANADQSQFGLLEVDGSINTSAMLELRH